MKYTIEFRNGQSVSIHTNDEIVFHHQRIEYDDVIEGYNSIPISDIKSIKCISN